MTTVRYTIIPCQHNTAIRLQIYSFLSLAPHPPLKTPKEPLRKRESIRHREKATHTFAIFVYQQCTVTMVTALCTLGLELLLTFLCIIIFIIITIIIIIIIIIFTIIHVLSCFISLSLYLYFLFLFSFLLCVCVCLICACHHCPLSQILTETVKLPECSPLGYFGQLVPKTVTS